MNGEDDLHLKHLVELVVVDPSLVPMNDFLAKIKGWRLGIYFTLQGINGFIAEDEKKLVFIKNQP